MTLLANLSAAEYLEQEIESEIRHEYVDGRLYAMAGESKRHEVIVLNIAYTLYPLTKAKGCRLQTKTIQLRVSSSRYRYPDIMINCLDNNDPRLEDTPCFLLEVISASTADTDSHKKLSEYTRIPSVERYVLVEQHTKLVVVYKRQGEVWLVETLEETGEIEIPCIGTTLTLEQIYDGLEFQT
jgi:Uma2 family endonuclease